LGCGDEATEGSGCAYGELDFIPDYDENRSLVTSFSDAARSGASWLEASEYLFEPKMAEVRRICKHFFDLERVSPGSTSAP
jgi:hypothetical protein